MIRLRPAHPALAPEGGGTARAPPFGSYRTSAAERLSGRMSELLFHTPWWLPTAIITAGVILFLAGNRRTQGSVRTAGALVIGLGVLLIAVSWAVDTDVEKVENRSKELVESAGHNDWSKVESLLSPTAHFTFKLGGRQYGDRQELIDAARKASETTGLRSAWVASDNVQPTGTGLITTEMRVFSDQDKVGGHQIPSDWQLDWQKENGQWVVTEIRLIQVGDVTPEAINQHLK
jgi:hypothetical protein